MGSLVLERRLVVGREPDSIWSTPAVVSCISTVVWSTWTVAVKFDGSLASSEGCMLTSFDMPAVSCRGSIWTGSRVSEAVLISLTTGRTTSSPLVCIGRPRLRFERLEDVRGGLVTLRTPDHTAVAIGLWLAILGFRERG